MDFSMDRIDRGPGMKDEGKTKGQLVKEMALLRREVAELEEARAGLERTVEALKRSEAYFRAITQNSSDIIIVVDALATITYVSPSVERFVGYRPEELIGRSGFELITAEDNPRAIEDFGRALLTKEVVIPNAFNIRHKDGTVRILEGVGKNLLDEPAVAGFVMHVRDITDRRQTEEERRQLQERLNRAERMEALGTLAGGVAHDLNNALGVLIGYSELILNDIGEESPVRPYVLTVLEGGEKASAVVRDLLILARRGVQTTKVVNLNQIIHDCLKSQAFEKLSSLNPLVRFGTELDADLNNIMAAPGHLGKVLTNLLTNAAEAMPEGGHVLIRTDNRYLDRPVGAFDHVREGDYAVLSVSDSGKGISERDRPHIFEPFYTKKVMGQGGTGLGLAVVWGAVRDYDGYIDVQSQEGKGSTFSLYFPATRDPLQDEKGPVDVSRYKGRGEVILVVDDVPEQRNLAATMLNRLNYKVVMAANGEEAVAFLRKGKADLVVLDMIMDLGMNGLETYQEILGIHPHQKAIIVSGFSEMELVAQVQALGAGEYVRKPYSLESLGMAVRRRSTGLPGGAAGPTLISRRQGRVTGIRPATPHTPRAPALPPGPVRLAPIREAR
jgi:PAS domain S-box-containing protein